MTHDLLRTVIDTLGGSVQHILVSDLQNDTFYAKIAIQTNGTTKDIDCRPSDAVALAVRAQVPIYVDESVLEKAGILLDKETGKPIGAEQEDASGSETPPEVKEEELRRMSAFTDFIDSLDLEDFGKDKPKT